MSSSHFPQIRVRTQGFALVSTLAVIIIVTIIIVAFLVVMRTERSASQNFTDHSRAEAVAFGMLNRIMAQHAVPMVNDHPLERFKVGEDGNDKTGLPSKDTAGNYFGATSTDATGCPVIPILSADKIELRQTLQPIYEMVPDDEKIMDETGLVRTSKPLSGAGKNAYTADYWAYDGLTEKVLGTTDAQPQVIPQWVDYYETDVSGTKLGYPSAQIAYAIWDEGGKFDVNMAGKDKTLNGLAPHDLHLEMELSGDDGSALTTYLKGKNGKKESTNFSLRQIISPLNPSSGEDDKGDDRWIFSVRELVEKKLVDPTKIRQVTVMSRDFDVRPEWDGVRVPLAVRQEQGEQVTLGADDYLKSYINNPNIYGLIYGAGNKGPGMVKNTLNNVDLKDALNASSSGLSPQPVNGTATEDDWMQVMRMLAILRRSFPDYKALLAQASSNYDPDKWSAYDIWGVAMNIAQAGDTASDHNLIAYDPTMFPILYNDVNARMGIRISPYITEGAVKVTATTGGYQLQLYVELWNPFPFKMKYDNGQPVKYRVAEWTGGQWPVASGTGSAGGVYPLLTANSIVNDVEAPDPGKFKVIRFPIGPVVPTADFSKQVAVDKTGITMRIRPYLQDMRFYTPQVTSSAGVEPSYYCIEMAGYTVIPGTNDVTNCITFIPATMLPQKPEDPAVWYSFQIDDPRMGSIRRNVTSIPSTAIPVFPSTTDRNQSFGWIGYLNTHSLDASAVYDYSSPNKQIRDDSLTAQYKGKTFDVANAGPVAGFNQNFGTNWPNGDSSTGVTDQDNFNKMMATFALPGRPLLNISELGTVFAFRPWITLNFANKIIPTAMDGGRISKNIEMATPEDASKRPAAFLDYYSTLGTTTDDTQLPYLAPSSSGPVAGSAYENRRLNPNLNKRIQDKSWLFESLTSSSSSGQTVQTPTGNLRPIRGRVNLNTAGWEVLKTLLKAPYRMPASLGLEGISSLKYTKVSNNDSDSNASYQDPQAADDLITIDESDAEAVAKAITLPITDPKAIRPLRTLSDLSALYDNNSELMQGLYQRYPQSVISAMIGRLAQFGTVREQAYTIDIVARALNPAWQKKNAGNSSAKRPVMAEVRLQARISFDTFTRKAYIESMQYR